MGNSASTVWVVDEDEKVWGSIHSLLKSIDVNIKPFVETTEFLACYDPFIPGCLVLDIRLRGMSGLELQEVLSTRNIDLPIIFLTRYGDVSTAVRAMKMGALDFIGKPFDPQHLLERIQQGIRQDLQKRRKKAEDEELLVRYNRLTEREKQIMDFMVVGRPNKVIATEMGLSKKTVEFHRSHVMEKMHVESVAHLVRLDLQLGKFKESGERNKDKSFSYSFL